MVVEGAKSNKNASLTLKGFFHLALIITLLLIDYDSSKQVNCQLEAVGAVLSVVPVTSILATAGLVGVKLAALSRLLQALGYDQAYLASGGSGTAAQPIGLQTNYAYMFPYVPGLNISVKGEHGSQYQNQASQMKEAYSTTRKTFPAMGLPGDYESQNSAFRGAETLKEIFKDSGIEFRYPTGKQQQQLMNAKGNGHKSNVNLPNPNHPKANSNPQQLATNPTTYHETHHHPSTVLHSNNNNNNNNNNNFNQQPAPNTNLEMSNLPGEPAANNHFGLPDPNRIANNQQPQLQPVNVIGLQAPDTNMQPSTSSSPISRPDGPASIPLSPSSPVQPASDIQEVGSSSSSSMVQPTANLQPAPASRPHRIQNLQVNMPHPSNIRPPPPPIFSRVTHSEQPPPPSSTLPPTSPLPESHFITGSITVADERQNFHPVPQHEHFYKIQKLQAAALPSGQLTSGPPLPHKKPAKSFDEYAKMLFGASDGPKEGQNLAGAPLPGPDGSQQGGGGTPSGPIGHTENEVTTNLIPTSFSTEQTPPFHDDMENNEISLTMKRRRRKRDLNDNKPARETSPLSHLIMPPKASSSSVSSQLHAYDNHNQGEKQRDVKNENFGMPAANIHPSVRRRRRRRRRRSLHS